MEKTKKILAIVQARMGSIRFPNKVMKMASGKPLIQHLFERLSKSNLINKIVLATSLEDINDPLVKFMSRLGYAVYRGSGNDVLDRYYQVAKQYNADVIVRVTGDCPLIDYQVTDKVIKYFVENDFDYVSNVDPPTFPDGLETEVFTFEALEKTWKKASQQHEREHVTPYIRESGLFSTGNFTGEEDFSGEIWTVDYPEDFQLVKAIFEEFNGQGKYFGFEDILKYKESHPQIFKINKNLDRRDGATMSSGMKLWNRAKKAIPGGNMLLSKRAEMFLPEKWPTYYTKAKGCKVWDLDGNQYIDMSIMGIGTCSLGYANTAVNRAVKKAIDNGSFSTLNTHEEVELAEKLIDLHPYMEMVRFARSGGEANAIAVRIARATSGKSKVALCGYHGWHDWYLAANLSGKNNLDGLLLPGLEPAGVPVELENTSLPFHYGKIEELEALVSNHGDDIGVICVEVQRGKEADLPFLRSVRKIANKINAVLIFDEISSGFRLTIGGLYKFYGLEPDMVVLGKALGNGYAISAVLGKEAVMDAAQNSFISSSYWTERIGYVAALETIRQFEKNNVIDYLKDIGQYIKNGLTNIFSDLGLSIEIDGMLTVPTLFIKEEYPLEIKTLFTQEMLKRGFLASNVIYLSYAHNKKIIDQYLTVAFEVFTTIKSAIEKGTLTKLLKGPICHSGFQRLT